MVIDMKILKMVFAVVLCFTFVLSTVSITIFATDEYDNVPAMVQTEGIFVIGSGAKISGVLGNSALSGQAHLPGYSTGSPAQVSFTNPGLAHYSDFEFDYYVDDIAVFSTRKIKLYFNVRAAALISKGTFEFQNQITQSGWNHIKVAAALDGDVLNSLTIVRFYMDMNAGSAGASDRYRIANICATKDPNNIIPEIDGSEGVYVMGEGIRIKGTLGTSGLTGQAHLPGYSSATPAEIRFTNPGLSDYDYFEFDYYTDDIANFNSRAVKLYFNVRTDTTSKGTFEFDDRIIQSGWNHVKIAADLDNDKLNSIIKVRFYMDMDAGTAGASDNYMIANICATKDLYYAVPEMSQSDGVFEIYNGAKFEGVLGNSKKTDQAHLPGYSSAVPAQIKFSNPGLAEYDFFEFDYFTDDVDSFTTRAIKLYFNVRTNNASKGIFEFQGQIAHSGWNHIKLAMNLSADELNSLTIVGFYTSMNAGSAGASDRYRIANICATKDPYGIVPEMIESEYMFVIGSGALIDGVFGSSELTGQAHLPEYSSSSPAEKQFVNPGLSDYGCFEFDYFVDDIDSFNARNVKLYFNVRAANDVSLGTFEFEDQITANGWNHVKVAAALSDDELNSITKARFYTDMDAGDTGASDRYRIANICATKDPYGIIPEITQSEDILVIGSGALIEGTLGGSALAGQAHLPGYGSGNPAEIQFTNTGLSDYGCFEFDYYTDRMADLKTRNIKLYLNVRAANNVSLGTFEFEDQITENGWNHIKVAAALSDDELNAITKVRFYIDMDAGEAGASDRYRIANIYATKDPFGVIPEIVKSEDMVLIAEGAKIQGTFGNSLLTGQAHLPGYSSGNPAEIRFENTGLTDHGCFEFDYYVDNVENLNKRAAKLYFNIRDNSTSRGTFEFQKQITRSGWNHVKIDASLDNDLLNSISVVRFYMDINAGSEGAADRYRVANIFASKFVAPDLPDNVVAQIGTLKSATLGDYFHTAEDRLYEEKLAAVDFSKATAIEFDLYIDDYEALLAAEKASAENYSGLPYARESRLALYLSSTPANLWQQYSKPRRYFSVRITLSDKITHNGWNHIVVGKGDFTTNSQTIDWANLTGWMVAFIYGSDAHKEANPYPNVTVSICNIVNTGVVSDVPKDSDKDVFPDKNAVYISNAEAVSDANGTWNPRSVYISNDYKSEGKASALLDLDYHSAAEDAKIYYLFDETADMSDLKVLKFDFFIDLPQFIQASGNKAEIIIANRRNDINDFYKWDLDFSKLKTGWNPFELNIDSVTISGKPDLSECKVVMLRFTELSIDAKVFAQIVIGIDNLRYLSSVGSTELKINDDSGEFDDQDSDYNGSSDADNENIDNKSEQEINNKPNTPNNESNTKSNEPNTPNNEPDTSNNELNTQNNEPNNEPSIPNSDNMFDQEPIDIDSELQTEYSEPQTKYVKTIRKLTAPDCLISGIVLGSEAVIALAGVVTFIIIYQKKEKKKLK